MGLGARETGAEDPARPGASKSVPAGPGATGRDEDAGLAEGGGWYEDAGLAEGVDRDEDAGMGRSEGSGADECSEPVGGVGRAAGS